MLRREERLSQPPGLQGLSEKENVTQRGRNVMLPREWSRGLFTLAFHSSSTRTRFEGMQHCYSSPALPRAPSPTTSIVNPPLVDPDHRNAQAHPTKSPYLPSYARGSGVQNDGLATHVTWHERFKWRMTSATSCIAVIDRLSAWELGR